MVILHIACTNGDMCNGVQVVVPQHLDGQSKYADVAFVNISNIPVESVCEQFEYTPGFSVSALKSPFDRPDLVVFHECYRIPYLKIAKELKKRAIPYVIIPHGELADDAQKKKKLKKAVANKLFFNRFTNGAAAIQLLSETEHKNTHFGKKKFIGTNGIHISIKKKECFREFGMKFVYIGRLDVYHKGLDLMIEGIAGCADLLREKKCTLDIYGPDILGRMGQVKKMIQDNHVGDIVKLHTPVFDGEKEKVLLDADVFIQTSRFEGMPMGILEALSYGLPCVVTDGTTLRTLIEDNDAGFGTGTTAEDITYALRRVVIEKDGLLRMSKNARRFTGSLFSWDNISKETVEQYMHICNER